MNADELIAQRKVALANWRRAASEATNEADRREATSVANGIEADLRRFSRSLSAIRMIGDNMARTVRS